MIPAQIFDQITDKCTEGLALALACDDDGAIMELQWCNTAFTRITGYTYDDIIGRRGTVLIGIGKSLGMSIVAEGVDTESHAQFASAMGCDCLQGFHFGKPMCADDLRERLFETRGEFWHPRTELAG